MVNIALFRRSESEEPEWVVILTVIVALALGFVLQSSVLSRTQTADVAGMRVSFPDRWARVTEEGAAFAATDLSKGIFGPRLTLRELPAAQFLPEEGNAPLLSLADLAAIWSLQRGNDLTAFRVQRVEQTLLQGRAAVNVSYAYLGEARQGAVGRVVPRVMQGVDTLIAATNKLYVLSFVADSNDFPRMADTHAQLLNSWRAP